MAAQVQQAFAQSMAALPAAQAYWVALSGGLDSMVLAHLASKNLPAVRLLHINHGLSLNAQCWQQQVERWAEQMGLPCVCIAVDVDRQAASLERAARDARYGAFASTLGPAEALLLAHHRDDQAETLLLRLLRGSGLKGLTAMAPVRTLGQGHLLRPLLSIGRAQLAAYAQHHSLVWVEDESNSEQRFDRNWLRHSLIPLLGTRWPAASEQLAHTCARLRDEQELLDTYLAEDFRSGEARQERLGHSLLLAPLLRGSNLRRNALLRYWFNQLAILAPSQAVMAQMQRLLTSRPDSEACVTWGQWQLRRFAGRLYVLPQLPQPTRQWQAQWHTAQTLVMANGSQLSACADGSGLAAGTYSLRLRQGGERAHPQGRAHSQLLKKLLQETQLEPWLRDCVPLIYRGENLVAVGDLWIEREFLIVDGVRPQWRFG